jgi:hypothetical protein
MPPQAKPYKEHGWSIRRAGGEYVRLCPVTEEIAKAILRDHLQERDRERRQNGGRVLPRLAVSEVLAMFLDAVEVEKGQCTFADYQR